MEDFTHVTLMVKVYAVVVNGGNKNKNTNMIDIEYNYMTNMQMEKLMYMSVNKTYSHFKSIIVNSISLHLLKYKIAPCLIYHGALEMKNKDFRLFNTYSVGKGFFQINWAHFRTLLNDDDTYTKRFCRKYKIQSKRFSVLFFIIHCQIFNLISNSTNQFNAQTMILVYVCILMMLFLNLTKIELT